MVLSNLPKRKQFFNLNATTWIVLINVICFLVFSILLYFNQNFIDYIALMPSNILNGKYIWTVVTNMFMHSGFFHLFANMISLLFMGKFVETLIGKKRFLHLYFVGGLFANLLFVLIAFLTKTDMNVYAIGASGAIFALGGLLAVLTPKLKVLVFFILPLPMWAAMAVLMAGLWILSLSLGVPIGNVAHLGGLLTGLIYGLYLKKKFPRKTKLISDYFSR